MGYPFLMAFRKSIYIRLCNERDKPLISYVQNINGNMFCIGVERER